MYAQEILLKKIQTPEGKAEIDKWIDDFIKKQKIKDMEIKSIISNTNYFEWLNLFTQDKESFFDDEWLYFPEAILESDRKNVEKLCLFYEGIDRYASSNYIYPTPWKDFGNYYRIRLNQFGYEIGMAIGQGSHFFCRKASIDNPEEFIDFNDIMNDKKQNQVDFITTNLDSLSNMVLTAYENGVPIEAIVNRLDQTIKKINSREEKKSKTLIKSKKEQLL